MTLQQVREAAIKSILDAEEKTMKELVEVTIIGGASSRKTVKVTVEQKQPPKHGWVLP